MEPTIGLPKFLPRWLCFVVFWILLSVLFASQLLLGAIVISLLQPALTQLIIFMGDGVQWLLSFADAPPRSFLPTLHIAAVRVAGYNLPVYAGVVLAWHAMTYYAELRDRQVRAMEWNRCS